MKLKLLFHSILGGLGGWWSDGGDAGGRITPVAAVERARPRRRARAGLHATRRTKRAYLRYKDSHTFMEA
ncbi:MAG: hypothetical protein WDN28_16675 [Chthoniobacter sp.]